jgi:CheY-like chemotaxis protein
MMHMRTAEAADMLFAVQPGRGHNPILIVDDDEDTRAALATLLEQSGFTVVRACDGVEALEHLRSGLQPCLILLDLFMPRKDGWEFRAEQVADPLLSGIPTIAYSADESIEDRAVALGLPFFKKPAVLDRIVNIVRRYC